MRFELSLRRAYFHVLSKPASPLDKKVRQNYGSCKEAPPHYYLLGLQNFVPVNENQYHESHISQQVTTNNNSYDTVLVLNSY